MKLTSLVNEISSELASEMEIIYRDHDVVAMIPKTQKVSRMYGKGANWCQKEKRGFDEWSKYGLLIRFLLRGGRKIRFTYFYKKMDNAWGHHKKNTYYWANESGWHVLEGDGDPFEPQPKNPNRIRDLEKDIIEQIARIPEEAKEKVREFITQHKLYYDYCYYDEDFKTKKEVEDKAIFEKIRNMIWAYRDSVEEVYGIKRPEYDLWVNVDNNILIVNLYDKNKDPNKATTTEHFKNFNEGKDFVIKILNDYWGYYKQNYKEKKR